jgi:hypothetical protein
LIDAKTAIAASGFFAFGSGQSSSIFGWYAFQQSLGEQPPGLTI